MFEETRMSSAGLTLCSTSQAKPEQWGRRQPDWVLVLQHHTRIAIVDLYRLSDVHPSQLLAAAILGCAASFSYFIAPGSPRQDPLAPPRCAPREDRGGTDASLSGGRAPREDAERKFIARRLAPCEQR